jgi:hypothetical protein
MQLVAPLQYGASPIACTRGAIAIGIYDLKAVLCDRSGPRVMMQRFSPDKMWETNEMYNKYRRPCPHEAP